MTTHRSPLLSMRGMGKRYDGATVLDDVDFELHAGEVHVLAGENGAGKSTLMKILAGAVEPDSGEIFLDGRTVTFRSPRDAHACGIAVMYQELSLVESMTVAENLSLGREHGVMYPMMECMRIATDTLRELRFEIDTSAVVSTLPLADRQRVELARAVQSKARIIIMDEPTSALSAKDADALLALVKTLASRGTAIVFISHRMDEIYRVADRITVLRDGKLIGTFAPDSFPPQELIRAMIGRELTRQFPVRNPRVTETQRLEVSGLSVTGELGNVLVDNIHFTVRAGEILGMAGLQGSGIHEILEAVYGALGSHATGTFTIDGRKMSPGSPREAIAIGIAFVGGDRAATGIIHDLSIEENIVLAAMPGLCRGGWLQTGALEDAAMKAATEVRLQPRSMHDPVATLSGGNQQKALLARARATRPKLLLLDDPTRGVDVGVKYEFYELMNSWTAAGCSIILVSSDLQELLAMSDRIVVMHRGKDNGTFARETATAAVIIEAAMNMLRN